MPNVSSVNLSYLDLNQTRSATALINQTRSATALIKLADFANGPLRLQKRVENGVPVIYLGVRSWSTYFFEKLVATPGQVAKAKVKTQVAIDQHVRSFLNNSRLTLGKRSAEKLTAELQSKVVGKPVEPQRIFDAATEQDSKSSKMPFPSPPKYVYAKGKIFHGFTTVPTGVSAAQISPLQVIADVRLITEASYRTHPRTDLRGGRTMTKNDFEIVTVEDSEGYKKKYLERLNAVAELIKTSVVLETQPDSGEKCSDDNLEGALEAAKAFVIAQGTKGKHVSVMVTMRERPLLPNRKHPTAVEKDTGAKGTSLPVVIEEGSDEDLLNSSE